MSTITEQMTEILLEKYGPFLTVDELASTLKRSTNGLRVTLQQNGPVSKKLNAAKSKVGRRVYFNAISVAQIMTEKIEKTQ